MIVEHKVITHLITYTLRFIIGFSTSSKTPSVSLLLSSILMKKQNQISLD